MVSIWCLNNQSRGCIYLWKHDSDYTMYINNKCHLLGCYFKFIVISSHKLIVVEIKTCPTLSERILSGLLSQSKCLWVIRDEALNITCLVSDIIRVSYSNKKDNNKVIWLYQWLKRFHYNPRTKSWLYCLALDVSDHVLDPKIEDS